MYCRKCGKELPENTTECPECGTSLEQDHGKPIKRKKKFAIISILIVFMILLIIICKYISSQTKNVSQAADPEVNEEIETTEGEQKEEIESTEDTQTETTRFSDLSELFFISKEELQKEGFQRVESADNLETYENESMDIKVGYGNSEVLSIFAGRDSNISCMGVKIGEPLSDAKTSFASIFELIESTESFLFYGIEEEGFALIVFYEDDKVTEFKVMPRNFDFQRFFEDKGIEREGELLSYDFFTDVNDKKIFVDSVGNICTKDMVTIPEYGDIVLLDNGLLQMGEYQVTCYKVADNHMITYVEADITGDMKTDAQNLLLYVNEQGEIVDSNGAIIPEYSYVYVNSNGDVTDGENIIEGFFKEDNRILFKQPEAVIYPEEEWRENLTFDFVTDVTNGQIYANNEGKMCAYDGTIIPEYEYIVAMDRGLFKIDEIKVSCFNITENNQVIWVQNDITGDLLTDVQNLLLFANEDGKIVDSDGNIISEYNYVYVNEQGAVADSEGVIEGFFTIENTIVYQPPKPVDYEDDDSSGSTGEPDSFYDLSPEEQQRIYEGLKENFPEYFS